MRLAQRGPRSRSHPQIGARLDLAEIQFDRQVEDRRLGGRQVVLSLGDGLDLDERAEPLGQVERDLDLPAEMGEVERSPRLADDRDEPEPQVLEEPGHLLERIGPLGERDLDLLARLGRPASPGPLVRDPIGLADAAESKRLVRRGEITRGVAQVDILLRDRGRRRGPQRRQLLRQPHVVVGPIFQLDLEAHAHDDT